MFSITPAFAGDRIDENDLGYHLAAYFKDIDLNNDGQLESVKVITPYGFFTNIPDSEWADDTGTTITIIDSKGKELFWSEVNRYQPIRNVAVEDLNKDGFLKIVISVGQAQEYEATTYTYGWEKEAYTLITEIK